MANFSRLEDYNFSSLCKTFERFEIPKFQRPYSWKNKQLQDFFSSIVENENNYFVGNIISIYNKTDRTEEFEPIQIIDGQQRITTILLLLSVIKSQLGKIDLGNDDSKTRIIKGKINLIEALIFWRDLEDIESDILLPILSFNKKEYNLVFNKILLGEVQDIDISLLGDNEKRIISNFHILNKLVESHIKEDSLNNLITLLTKVRELQFIFIGVSSDNDIYGIFEGFNATGLGLSVADLIKNTVLKHTRNNSEIQDNVNFLWDEMEDLFSSTNISLFPKFIRYQWIANNGYISLSNLYGKINDEKIKGKTEVNVYDYVKELNQDSKIFLGLMNSDFEEYLDLNHELLSHFKKFRYLRNEQVYEILLSYYKLLKNDVVKTNTMLKYLKLLWYFIVRSRFISINPSDYEKIFAQHCKEISTADKSNIPQYLDIFISKLRPFVSDDKQFIENLVSDLKYSTDWKEKGLVREILSALVHNKDESIQMNQPEIEHILPQKPQKWGLKESDIKSYVHKIGNLTLLFSGDNKEVGNEAMAVKSENFLRSHFKFNKDISQNWASEFETDFGNAIDRRSLFIGSEIASIWKL